MTLEEIRRSILSAIASDAYLVNLLVFKGGNALELIHKIGQRASVDLDFSVEADLDAEKVRERLFEALHKTFGAHDIGVFDETFGPRPNNRQPGSRWGGYNAEFKLIDNSVARVLGKDLEAMRRQAIATGPSNQRKFRIEISAFEYTHGKQLVNLEEQTCFVYSTEMIAIEKLRAICQQSPDYPMRVHPAPRARDFYDIVAIVTSGGVDFEAVRAQELVRNIFGTKDVPLHLIGRIHEQREFHRADWPSVEVAVRIRLRQFDYYFEYVLAECEKLKSLWIM